MNEVIDQLTKLASELTERVDMLEKENANLKTSLEQTKQAAAKPAAVTAVVPEKVVDVTLDLLYKSGGLTADQLKESKVRFMTDPSAAHNVIQKLILDAQTQTKTASISDIHSNISGGTPAGRQSERIQHLDDACYENMKTILNL